ncbi:MAG: phosphotransferase [Chloroflexota bacterium]
MKPYLQLTEQGKARRLRKLVKKALTHYDLNVTRIRLMTNGVNGIFRLDTVDGQRYVMRVATPDSGHNADHYHTEMTWLDVLHRETDLNAPIPLKTKSGEYIVTVADEGVPQPRHCCIFSWVKGRELGDDYSSETFELFGALSAKLHKIGNQIALPNADKLPIYDTPFPFAEPNVIFDDEHQQHFTDEQLSLIEMAIGKVQADIDTLYQDTSGITIIHGDLHQWNVLLYRKQLSPIDFEDMMRAYPIQDIAVTLYYNRFDDNYEDLLAGFKRGYETIAPFPETYTGQLETHILSRRIGLVNFVLASEEYDISEESYLIPRLIERIHYLQKHIW